MQRLHKKNKITFPKGWIPIANIVENTRRGRIGSTSSHLYHYAGNNPIRYSDPTGLFDWDTNTIQKGDCLSQIAVDCNKKYGTNYTADDLQSLNSDTISDKDKIYAGNHLNLGKAEAVQKRAAEYLQRAKMIYKYSPITEGKQVVNGQVMVGVNINFVGMMGFDGSIGLLFDLDDSTQSGLFLSGGFASGVSAGISIFGGYNSGRMDAKNLGTISAGYGPGGGSIGIDSNGNLSLSGSFSPIGLDAGFNFSIQHMIVLPFATEEEKMEMMNRYHEHH